MLPTRNYRLSATAPQPADRPDPLCGPERQERESHPHPTSSTKAGTAWMVTMVSRKPIDV